MICPLLKNPMQQFRFKRRRNKIYAKVKTTLTACATAVLTLSALPAAAGDVSYCPGTEPLAPDGIVLRMGEGYYRTCGYWTDSDSRRQFILKMNPALVPDLFSDYSASNLRVVFLRNRASAPDNYTRLMHRTGDRYFGGVRYENYEPDITAPNGKIHAGTYIYRGEGAGDDIPPHWVTCAGWAYLDEGRWLNCRVWVSKGNVTANLLFIGSKERGTGFLDHFADFARDIVRVLEVANVTDELDGLTGLDIAE